MVRATLLALVTVLFLQPAYSWAATKALTRAESVEVFNTNENYAVIVGVDRYESDNLGDLRYAVNDARQLSKFFDAQGYEVFTLLDYEANPWRILTAVDKAATLATNAGDVEGGNVVFAFSGHGFRDEYGNNYLATGETRLKSLRESALALSEVKETMRKAGVRQRVLFVDACRNVPGQKTIPGGELGFSLDSEAEGEAVLYSTRAGELSWEDDQLGHGVFTYFLLNALRGAAQGSDGLITFSQLQQYVANSVKRHVSRRFDGIQIPYQGGERSSLGEFVLARIAASDEVVPEMVPLKGGSFRMGSTDGYDNEKPVHRVNVESFDLGRYEVTVGQWRAYVESSGYRTEAESDVGAVGCATWSDGEWTWTQGASWRDPGFAQTEDHPVVCVSWNDAQSYVEWLNKNPGGGYRLPSESEWEFAARAGSDSKFHFGNDQTQLCMYGNGADKSTEGEFDWSNTSCSDGFERTAPIGSFRANGNRLNDMHGNVWEWVEDCWHDSYERAPVSGVAWIQGGDCGRRVLRGGSWGSFPGYLRSADRYGVEASYRDDLTGFRVSRSLAQ